MLICLPQTGLPSNGLITQNDNSIITSAVHHRCIAINYTRENSISTAIPELCYNPFRIGGKGLPVRKPTSVVSDQLRHKLGCSATETKALISFTVTSKLVCAYVFTYADCWFPTWWLNWLYLKIPIILH